METWSVVLALVAVTLSVYYYFKRNCDYFEKRGIPYKKSLPLFGNTWRAIFSLETYIQTFVDLYNFNRDAKYIGYYEVMQPMIMIRDVELAKQVMVKHFDHFQDRRILQAGDTDVLMSNNLVTLRGEKWKRVRNMLTPVFTSSKIKAMFKLMSECAERYGVALSNLTEKERVLEMKEIFSRYTNDTIASCAFGITLDTMADPKNQFYVYGSELASFGTFKILKILLARQAPRLAKMLGVALTRPEVETFYKDLVASTLKARKESGIYRPDLLQTLMEASNKLEPSNEVTIDDMTANASLFLAVGLENTANMMSFAAYEIAMNKGVQERLQNEIDGVLEQCKGKVTYDAINEMNYLDAVLRETMRMYVFISIIDRVCTKRFELPPALPGAKPVIVEKGDSVQIPIYAIQHDPQYFDNPDTFNPDRFSSDFRKIYNPGTFLTFGQGPRVCIANRFVNIQSKVLLFHLFAKCTLKMCSKTAVPLQYTNSFAMSAKDGVWLEVVPREKSRMVYMESVSDRGVYA